MKLWEIERKKSPDVDLLWGFKRTGGIFKRPRHPLCVERQELCLIKGGKMITYDDYTYFDQKVKEIF